MNKNFKVITINGIRGMFAAIFVVMGLIAGFIISPGWLSMTIWNHFAEETGRIVSMNLFQGIILWAIIALSLYALNNRRTLIGFGSYQGLTPEQLKDIMSKNKVTEDRIKRDIERISKELQNNINLKEISQEIKDENIDTSNTFSLKTEQKKEIEENSINSEKSNTEQEEIESKL
ncbi:hypothetical protein IJ182_09600 [bacterium]|nr:hypothetical protein [bacterium]